VKSNDAAMIPFALAAVWLNAAGQQPAAEAPRFAAVRPRVS
jgi:hypothetical protein